MSMTRKDVEHASELCKRRERIWKTAETIRKAGVLAVCESKQRGWQERPEFFQFAHLTDDLRNLIQREAAEQISVIDRELKDLGIEPDRFETVEPSDPNTIRVSVVRI
jgi:hypothetical protein